MNLTILGPNKTPTPWNVIRGNTGEMFIEDLTTEIVADIRGIGPASVANAAFIVRAVNAYDEMLNALEYIASDSTDDFELMKNRAEMALSIIKAEGK